MGPVFVVIADVIGKESLQVALVEGDNMVQQVTPTTLDPALRNSFLPRAPEGGSNRPYGHRPHGNRDFQTILGIPIKDEKPGSRLIRERFSQLLDNPQAAGMPSDIEMQDAASVAGLLITTEAMVAEMPKKESAAPGMPGGGGMGGMDY